MKQILGDILCVQLDNVEEYESQRLCSTENFRRGRMSKITSPEKWLMTAKLVSPQCIDEQNFSFHRSAKKFCINAGKYYTNILLYVPCDSVLQLT